MYKGYKEYKGFKGETFALNPLYSFIAFLVSESARAILHIAETGVDRKHSLSKE